MELPATATLEQAGVLLQQINAAVGAAAGGALRVDASALKDFDTSALALLLHARRAAGKGAVQLTVVGAPPKLRELAVLYGVDELLSLDGAAT